MLEFTIAKFAHWTYTFFLLHILYGLTVLFLMSSWPAQLFEALLCVVECGSNGPHVACSWVIITSAEEKQQGFLV